MAGEAATEVVRIVCEAGPAHREWDKLRKQYEQRVMAALETTGLLKPKESDVLCACRHVFVWAERALAPCLVCEKVHPGFTVTAMDSIQTVVCSHFRCTEHTLAFLCARELVTLPRRFADRQVSLEEAMVSAGRASRILRSLASSTSQH